MCDLSPKDQKDLKDLFDKHAKEGNKLPKRKLVCLLRDKYGDNLKGAKDPTAMRKFLNDMDEDGDGKYSFEEFMNAMAKC